MFYNDPGFASLFSISAHRQHIFSGFYLKQYLQHILLQHPSKQWQIQNVENGLGHKSFILYHAIFSLHLKLQIIANISEPISIFKVENKTLSFIWADGRICHYNKTCIVFHIVIAASYVSFSVNCLRLININPTQSIHSECAWYIHAY